MESLKRLLEELKGMDEDLLNSVVYQLLKSKKISYTRLSKLYVHSLEDDKKEMMNVIMPMAMFLGQATNGTLDVREAELYIHKAKFFEGAPFGDMLNKKFAEDKE